MKNVTVQNLKNGRCATFRVPDDVADSDGYPFLGLYTWLGGQVYIKDAPSVAHRRLSRTLQRVNRELGLKNFEWPKLKRV